MLRNLISLNSCKVNCKYLGKIININNCTSIKVIKGHAKLQGMCKSLLVDQLWTVMQFIADF